jgi:hypothetical protein
MTRTTRSFGSAENIQRRRHHGALLSFFRLLGMNCNNLGMMVEKGPENKVFIYTPRIEVKWDERGQC